jgi:ubiquinone/menaquinone biosynthesis C-methylase UbiE
MNKINGEYNLNLRNPLSYSVGTQVRILHLVKFLDNLPENSKILDLGCGIGFFSGLSSSKGSIYGVDPDRKAIEKAKQLYPFEKTNIYFKECCGENILFPNNSFDGLICSEVLEHVDDIHLTMNEICRVCRTGGKILITVPSIEGIFGTFFLNIGHNLTNKYEYHQRDGFTKKEIEKILEKYNITIKNTYYSRVFLTEIFMGVTKIFHSLIKKKPIEGQHDILEPPKFFKVLSNLFSYVGRFEDRFLSKLLKGHMIIIYGVIEKKT